MMGIKKEILFRTALSVLSKVLRDQRLIKKIAVAALVSVLVLLVCCGLLLYFVFGMVKDFVAGKPDMDLLAMERLIAEKVLVLSEEQQRLIAPVIEKLAVAGLAPEQAEALKRQLLNILNPQQLAQVEAWKAATTAKAADFLALPPAVAAVIKEYTGLTREMLKAKIDAFLAWWQLIKPENSALQLQKTMKNQ